MIHQNLADLTKAVGVGPVAPDLITMRIITLSLLTFSINGVNVALGKGYHGGGRRRTERRDDKTRRLRGAAGANNNNNHGMGRNLNGNYLHQTQTRSYGNNPGQTHGWDRYYEAWNGYHENIQEDDDTINCAAIAAGTLPFDGRREKETYNVHLDLIVLEPMTIASVLNDLRLQLQRNVATSMAGCDEKMKKNALGGANGDRITNVLFESWPYIKENCTCY